MGERSTDLAPALLEALDDDLVCCILQHCSGKSMAHAGATCSRCRQLADTAALLVLKTRRPNLLPPLGLQHNWVRALDTDEAMVQQLGQDRSNSDWRDEYMALQTEDFRLYQLLTGEKWSEEHMAFSSDFFGDGGERSIQACLLANASDIDWRVHVAGWTRGHAEVLTLLMTSGAAMSRSLTRIRTFAGRPRGRPAVALGRALSFPASVLAVSDALAAAAYRQDGQQPPPHLYTPLTLPAAAWDSGPGCLLEEDAAWAVLLRSKVKIGATLRTSAFVNAEEASRYALGSGEGFLIHNDDDERVCITYIYICVYINLNLNVYIFIYLYIYIYIYIYA